MIRKDMTIEEVIGISQDLIPILESAGMHCFGCPFARQETIEQACAGHGVDADKLIDALNAFMAR